jgi:hypothetical protein
VKRISDEEVINSFFQADRIDCHGRQSIAIVTAGLDLELGFAADFSDGAGDGRSIAIVEVEPVAAILARSIEAGNLRIDRVCCIEVEAIGVLGATRV